MQLNFLEAIEGASGERLASAVLQFLIVHSPTLRDRLVARLKHSIPPGFAPSFRNGIYCQTEYSTQDTTGALNGFIDILIGDGLVAPIPSANSAAARFSFAVAIEVKLWATFTTDQPAKYLPTLKSMVGGEVERRRCAVIVLAPHSRIPDVKKHVAGQQIDPPPIIWDWDDLRHEDLPALVAEESNSIAMVAKWFLRFLESRLGSMDLLGTADSYVGPEASIANAYQVDFLYKLKGLLPAPLRIAGTGEYYGLSCHCSEDQNVTDSARIWIGFAQYQGQVIFGIDTALPLTDTPKEFKIWGGRFYKIDFDPALRTALAWRNHLLPFLVDIERQHQKVLASKKTVASPANPS